jgi:hypothetical protein
MSSFTFHYRHAIDAWILGYVPEGIVIDAYPEPEYVLPGVVPEGDWALYAEMYGATDGTAVGLLVDLQDGRRISLLGTWNWPPDYTEEGGENTFVHLSTGTIELKVEYHSEAHELHLFVRSASTTGVWQPIEIVLDATPLDTGLLLRYAWESTPASGYLTGVRLLEGLEEPDGVTEVQLAPFAPVPETREVGVQPFITLGNEPTVYCLLGAPFGDMEFDIGKSARWMEYFSDKLFVLDINTGDPRYWIVNWTITFPDAEHDVTSTNYFVAPEVFRKELFQKADMKFNMDDDGWVLFVDGTEGLSFDVSSLPDDYEFNPFMSYVYREIARAEAVPATSVVLPLFVFLRSGEVQNVTYEHDANMEDGSFSVLQPISVPYYLAAQGMKRLIKVNDLRRSDFDWGSIDRLATPSAGVKAQIVSYAYAHWNLLDIQPGETEPPPRTRENDDGFRMRMQISKVRPITGLPLAWEAPDPVGIPGPWALSTLQNTHPDFVPITDAVPTSPNAAAAGVQCPLYDTVARLNMRDGVWYEGDVSGNTPMTWDALTGKWQTAYNPDRWVDKGVYAGDNPDYNEQVSPVPPTPVI